MTKAVYAIATMDTKGEELAFVASELRRAGAVVKTVDVGTLAEPSLKPDISREQVASVANASLASDSATDRGTAILNMANSLKAFLLAELAEGRVGGVIGLGGSGGTSLITSAMRAMPIGLPKLMVSTVASGNVAPYVDCSDITMVYSVVDIAGLNAVSELILRNAAHAMAGMVAHPKPLRQSRRSVGMTMFGVTTTCVTRVREQMEADGYDCYVFHATGTGGRSMEQLVESGLIGGVFDITTTEVADEVVGGVFPCGSQRFDRLLRSHVPLVMSVGALDMVNFGAIETVPERFRNRRLHVHNAQVTLMRTSVEENIKIGEWIARKLNQATSGFAFLIPEGGVSALDRPGQPFYDPDANAALFSTLAKAIEWTSDRRLVQLPYHVNAPEFADALVAQYRLQLQPA